MADNRPWSFRPLAAKGGRPSSVSALRTAEPVPFPLTEVWDAHRAAEEATPGRKVVLTMR